MYRYAAAGRKVLGKLTVNLSADVNDMVAMVPGRVEYHFSLTSFCQSKGQWMTV